MLLYPPQAPENRTRSMDVVSAVDTRMERVSVCTSATGMPATDLLMRNSARVRPATAGRVGRSVTTWNAIGCWWDAPCSAAAVKQARVVGLPEVAHEVVDEPRRWRSAG